MTGTDKRAQHATEDHDQWLGEYVTVEKSIFQTRIPRPTSTARHLVIVIAACLLALVLAIVHAEGTF